MLDLGNEHSKIYSNITQYERLKCLEMAAASFNRIQKNINDRLNRESCIPDEDIEQTVRQIVDYPYLGGQKGSLKLQCDEKAFVGSTTYQEIKHQLKTLAAKEVLNRKQRSELSVDQYKRYDEKQEPFVQIAPQKKHDVWAIDFLNLLLFGIFFRICVVYDIYSQAYLSIKPVIHATSSAAEQALDEACQFSGQIPELCLLSDNGSQFRCDSFDKTKKRLQIHSQYIPRGQPWYNGALESGNRDLRKVVYTNVFYDACKDTQLSKVGTSYDKIYQHLQTCCHKALVVINEKIARPKFKTTPTAVLNDQIDENQQKRIRFIAKKIHERKKRIEKLKLCGGSNRKRIEDKLAFSWKKISKNLSTEHLFAFSEMLHNRYKAITV